MKALPLIALLLAGVLAAQPALAQPASSVPAPPTSFQTRFDPIGPTVQSLQAPDGRTVHYADTGEAGWRPVLFLGGTGTSARAFLMMGYLETLRKQLHLRLISVERNGFGDTPYDPAWTYADYVTEVRAVLDHLGVTRFAMVAISGGGPYAAHIAAAMPERLLSLHTAAALANVRSPAIDVCGKAPGEIAKAMTATVQNPQAWWGYPTSSPTHAIPGFPERSYDEGARAFFIRGQMGDPAPEVAELHRYCAEPLPSLAALKAPLFTYYGGADDEVVPANAAWWRKAVSGPVTERAYPGEGHDVQYRHWDQIMLDMAGYGDRLLVCEGGRSRLVAEAQGQALPRHGASLGLCLWKPTAR